MEDSSDPLPGIFLLATDHFSVGTIFGILATVILLICSALVSGSEVAFFSLSSRDKDELGMDKAKAAKVVLELLERPKRLLATILISNNFINVAIVLLSSMLSQQLFHFETTTLPFTSADPVLLSPELQNFLVNVIAITFLILVFGEVVPKVYATKYPQTLSQLMSFPFVVLNKIFHPLSFVLVKSTNLIDKRLKKKKNDISVDELSYALDITSDEQAGDDDKRILKGIVKFGNTDTKQVMTPRVDVVAFDVETEFNELIDGIVDSGFSRLPIYEGDFDQIKGVLYIKDLLPYLDQSDQFQWQNLIREPLYVPENKKIDDLLEEFQERKIHLAVVVDEYGGSQGIVTLEDVIEEIVGDISDEFDEEDLVYSKLDDQNYVFEAKTPLKDVYKVLEIAGNDFEEEKGEADTLGGFVVEISGKIPKKNERVKFSDYTLTVEAADKRRVKRVKITLPNPEEDEPNQRSKNGRSTFMFFSFLLLVSFLAVACGEEAYTPKPRSYFRIALPQHTYEKAQLDCPFSFEYAENALLTPLNNKGNCWFNIKYPKLDATIHFTYFSGIKDSIQYFTEDARGFAMKHTVKADNIKESVIIDKASQVYGTVYDFEGSVASNFQFFLTDSVNHFIRGAMYFDTEPNPDSLAPVEKHIKQDLFHLIETFEWASKQE